MLRPLATAFVAIAVSAGSVGCSSGSSKASATTRPAGAHNGPDAAAPVSTFEATPPTVYVAKVKNLLVGLPPTDDEVKAVEADPGALGGLVDGWMALPEYEQKMQTFFELAFQQTQISITDLADQAYPRQADVNASTRTLLTQNVKESFARTVRALVTEGRPFTETMTTTRFMMTPALMELYAFFDAWQVNDDASIVDAFRLANPKLSVTVEAKDGPIPVADSVNPASPNYLHFYDPDVGDATKMEAGCTEDPIVYPARTDVLHYLLYGTLIGRKSPTGINCLQFGGTAAAPQIQASDFSTWKMISIRAAATGESPTPLYDLPALRNGTELVLRLPRVGFFTTPAFFANWQTNLSNQMRVTINQALIVATGAAVDGTDLTTPKTTPGLDSVHAPDGACFQCHQTLDPTRSILAATYSWNYHTQNDSAFSDQKGLFAFQGVMTPVSSVTDLANTFASHPRFAEAWAQKLCTYANSAPCESTDPEFQRVVSVFKGSSYSWSALVHEMFVSPLTTNAKKTVTTAENGGVVAVTRRDHLCAALNARFGFTDVCGLDATTVLKGKQTIPQIVAGLPSDGYGRGAVAPVLPNQPSLFYRAGMENICEAVAARVVDPTAAVATPNGKQWSSAEADAAIADFALTVMALTPSDPRSAPAQALLRSHFDAAVKTGASVTNALRSTFIVACLAPSAVSIGM